MLFENIVNCSNLEIMQNEIMEQTIEEANSCESTYENLFFEKEKNIPDFEQEPVYDLNNFGHETIKVDAILTPPPQFEEAINNISEDLLVAFKDILHGEITGIWPIKSQELLK